MQRLIITNSTQLKKFCHFCSIENYISIDTEFVRESTYYPKLCLIQISLQDKSALIDPLAEGMILDPLFDILCNPSVLKIFHAARQDLEIFYHLMGKVVYPIYDTQIAAMALDLDDQVAYHNLVKQYLGINLDKSLQMTQWDNRPLSQAQCEYAFLDVELLYLLYPLQAKQLKGREEWISDIYTQLIDKKKLAVVPEEAWKLIKLNHLKACQLSLAADIAAWRERKAQYLNIPRRWIISDNNIIALAQNYSTIINDNKNCFFNSKIIPDIADLLKIILMHKTKSIKQEVIRQRPIPNNNLLHLLRLILYRCTHKYRFASRLLCTANQLRDLSGLKPNSLDWQQHPTQQGWRKSIFGETAERVACGDIILRYNNGIIDFISSSRFSR